MFYPIRLINLVWIGSFAEASENATSATSGATPSNSNITRPGFTRQIQYSGDPLPLPIRTSAGFLETGTSGNIRIQTRPTRRMCLVIARRAASIWRAVIRAGSRAFKPQLPKFSVVPPLASPCILPLKALRNLVFLGDSISASNLTCCLLRTRTSFYLVPLDRAL